LKRRRWSRRRKKRWWCEDPSLVDLLSRRRRRRKEGEVVKLRDEMRSLPVLVEVPNLTFLTTKVR